MADKLLRRRIVSVNVLFLACRKRHGFAGFLVNNLSFIRRVLLCHVHVHGDSKHRNHNDNAAYENNFRFRIKRTH